MHYLTQYERGVSEVAQRRLHRDLCRFFGVAFFMLCTVLLSACGGGGDSGVGVASAVTVTAQIGPAGGTVTGPDGVQVVIPAGALTSTITIGITKAGVGAPALPSDFPQTGPVYEFTPHDVVFQLPVTIRMPVPAGAQDNVAFMASLGGEWQALDTIVVDGFANWQRNSFSFGTVGANCGDRNDPYQCVLPRSSVRVSATPTTGLTAIPLVVGGGFGVPPIYGLPIHFTVSEASVVRLTLQYAAAPDCLNPSVRLIRVNAALPASDPNRVQVLMDQPTSLVTASFPNPNFIGPALIRGVGTSTFDVAFSHLDSLVNPIGQSMFGYTFRCNRLNRPTFSTGELLVFTSTVPTPAVSYGIGGSISGLTGSGLVLQNNGVDNLVIGANGPFTFATPIGAGAPYAVTVRTQPTGQTCSVINGSGTAPQGVSNSVQINCVASAGNWQGAELREFIASGVEGQSARVKFDGAGNALALWTQRSGSTVLRLWTVRYTPAGGWETAVIRDAGGGAVSGADLAFDSSGNAILVWSEFDGTRYNIWASRYANGNWSLAALIESDNSGSAFNPQVGFDANGNAIATWAINTSGQTYRVASNTFMAGGAWQTPVFVSPATSSAGQSSLAVFPDGSADAVWIQTNGGVNQVWSNHFNGSTWGTASAVIAGQPVESSFPQVAADGLGNAIVIWTQDNGTQSDVFASRRSGGVWGAPVPMRTSSNAGSQDARLAMNASGQAIVVWQEDEASNSSASLWTRSYLPSGGWGSAIRLEVPGGYGLNPVVALNAAGTAVVGWPRNTAGFGLDEDMVAFRGTVAAGNWTGPTILSQGSMAGAAWSTVAIDGSGKAIALWQQFDASRSGPLDLWSNVFK